MKKLYVVMLLTLQLGLAITTNAQNIAINATGSLPDTSAMLDISSSTKGLLAPRMNTTQQNAIPLPANGLLIFNTTDNVFKVNTGTAVVPVWTPLALGSGAAVTSLNGLTAATQTFATGTAGTNFGISSSGTTHTFNLPTASASNRGALSSADWTAFNLKQGALTLTTTGTSGAATLVGNTLNIPSYNAATTAWSLTGNAATSGSQFLGSTNKVSLRMRTNNIERMVIDSVGNVGIGTTAPAEALSVTGNIALTTAGNKFIGNTGLTFEQNGDVFGTTRLSIQNRNAVNGAMFEQAGTVDLVDFVFKGLTNQRNIRYENRATYSYIGYPAPEFQIGIAGDPTLVVSDNAAAFRKGFLSIGMNNASALLHIKGGTAAAGTAPLKINAGTNLTTPEDGAVEYNGNHFYGTIGSTRYQLDQQGGGTVTSASVVNTNGFTGSVATATTTPAITLGTSISGMLKGNGTAISAATAGTDYLTPTGSAAGLTTFPTLNQNTTGTAANVTGTVAVVNGGTGLTTVTTGDMLYGSAANTLSRLPAGTNGQVLTLTSGIPSWITNPGASAWNLTGNTVTAGSQFLGSTNNVSLRIKTNNIARMVIDSTGRTGIGTSSPTAMLEINNAGSPATAVLKLRSPLSGSGTDSVLTWNPADSSVRRVTTSSLITGVTLPLMLANGTVSSTTSLRDYDSWVTQKPYGGNFVTDVQNTISNPIPNEGAWFALSNVGTYPNSAGVNSNYFGQTSLNDHNFYFRGGTAVTSTGVVTSPGWQKMLSIPATSQTNIAIDASNNANFNVVDNASLTLSTNNASRILVDNAGHIGIGVASPTAALHLKAGTAAAGTSPLKFTSGNNLTTPENGAVEFNGTHFYGTVGTTRYQLDQQAGGGTVTSTSVVSANGFSGTVTTATTTPAITLGTTITGLIKGNGTAIAAAVSGTDYQAPLTLTTTGTSGAASLTGNTLNIPNYATVGSAWSLNGNSGITQPATPATYGTSTLGASENFLGTKDTKDLVIASNNRERMRILNSNGFVGIGTAAPSKPLDLVANLSNTGVMKIQNTNASGYSSIDIWSNTTQIGNIGFSNGGASYPNAFYFATNTTNSMVFATNNTERLRINGSNGNVGIGGVAVPTALLHLDAGTATANTAPLKFTAGTNLITTEDGAVEYDGTNYFATSGGTRYTLAKTLTNTATLDFPSTNKLLSADLTITVTGAELGDVVQVGVPFASVINACSYSAFVSSNDTVTVRFSNNSNSNNLNPASGTFRVSVIKY